MFSKKFSKKRKHFQCFGDTQASRDRMALGCTISSPDMSQSNSCHVRFLASELFRGQRYRPSTANLLYIRTKPSPSHKSALIRSHLFPQNRNSEFSFGSRFTTFSTTAHRPSIAFRISVYPHYPEIWIMRVILIKVLSSSFR